MASGLDHQANIGRSAVDREFLHTEEGARTITTEPKRPAPFSLKLFSWRGSLGYCGSSGARVGPDTFPNASVDRLRKGHVRLISQNIWNSFFEGGSCRNERPERLSAFCEYLQGEDYDVVACQEQFVFGGGPLIARTDADAWSDAMSSLGFVHQTSAAAIAPCIGMSSGLVVYSKLPIVRHRHTPFSKHRPFAHKGWLEVELKLPEGAPQSSFTLVNVHLEHSHEPSWKAVREAQWRQLTARLSQLSAPVVMAGDFNVCSDEFGQAVDGLAEYSAMTSAFSAAGFEANLVAAAQGLPSVRYEHLEDAPAGISRQTLDHVFVSAPIGEHASSARIVDTRGASGLPVSDHRAAHIELHLS